jgi:hypothetical protein
MRGHYDSYGRVFKDKQCEDSFEWKMHWSDVCDMMFNDNKGDGIAVVLENYFTGNIPTEQSEGDPDQGWGEYNGDNVKITEPTHIVY